MFLSRKLLSIVCGVFIAATLSLVLATPSNAAPQPYPTVSTSSVPSSAIDATSLGSDPATSSAAADPGNDSGQSAGNSSGLSSTGVAVFGITALGLVLLIAGSILVFGGRRKTQHR